MRPEIAAALAAGADAPPMESMSVDEARRLMSADSVAWWGPIDTGTEARQDTVELAMPGGIRVRRYGAPAEHGGAVLHFHGGGWVVGNLDDYAGFCGALSDATSVPVYSVDYRLAPEHRFPAAADDAERAYDWICQSATELGVTPTRLVVAGDSAGGNLAAVCAQHAARRGGPLAGQVLIYPVTSAAMDTDSYRECGTGCGLTATLMQWFFDHYTGAMPAGDALAGDPRLSPLAAADLTGLAPALVITAELDPLCDEGRRYADRLQSAGVAVERHQWAGMIHGFSRMRQITPATAELFATVVRYVTERTRGSA